MQDEQTLIELGFTHYPEWDGKDSGFKHYRKESNGKVFRAYVLNCNGSTYISLGEVATPDGKVKRWQDCCSLGSVARKINQDNGSIRESALKWFDSISLEQQFYATIESNHLITGDKTRHPSTLSEKEIEKIYTHLHSL